MRNLFLFLLIILSTPCIASEGVIKVKSNYPVQETADRLEQAIKNKGLTFFTRISHSENAEKANMDLKPTVLLIFGNPKIGTPIMQCSRSAAIDLPQKFLIYQEADDSVWILYNDPSYLAKRHNIEGCKEELRTVSNVLNELSENAAE